MTQVHKNPLLRDVATVALTLSLLSACSAGDDGEHSPAAATVTPSKSPEWDSRGHSAAQAAGAKLLRTWSRSTMAYDAWWADLEPLLSPEARAVYSYTDPASIPALKITGDGAETNNDNPFLVTITFPTTKGRFGVDLSRTSLNGKWIGESIIFPGEYSRMQG